MSATTESSSSQISPEILKFDDCIDEGGGHQKLSQGLKKPPKNLGLSSTLEQTVLPGRVSLHDFVLHSPCSNLPPKHVQHNTLINLLGNDLTYFAEYLGNKKCLSLSCPFEQNQIKFEPFASKK